MEKLDFSGISTETLERQIKDNIKEKYLTGCYHLDCENCPLDCNGFEEINRDRNERAFKEELERRENMNEMPELKAGMILKLKGGKQLFLYINNSWAMNLNCDMDWTNITELGFDYIEEVFECVHYSKTYKTCTKKLKLIWSRKSDKDIKIEEIQKKMDALSKEMEELKG